MRPGSPQQHLCGLQFQRFRRARGRIIADQAKALNVSVSFISNIETNITEIPPWYINKFADWLELLPDEAEELRIKLSETTNKNQKAFSSNRKFIPQTAQDIRATKLQIGGIK